MELQRYTYYGATEIFRGFSPYIIKREEQLKAEMGGGGERLYHVNESKRTGVRTAQRTDGIAAKTTSD